MNGLVSLGKTENVKQVEFLNDIRDVGMSIVFGECDADVFSLTFEQYLDYVEKPSEYLKTIKEIYNMILRGECSPDDLLLKMGKHTKEIEYEEPEIDYDCLCYDDDEDNDIDLEDLLTDSETEVIELSEEAAEQLVKILSKLSEE